MSGPREFVPGAGWDRHPQYGPPSGGLDTPSQYRMGMTHQGSNDGLGINTRAGAQGPRMMPQGPPPPFHMPFPPYDNRGLPHEGLSNRVSVPNMSANQEKDKDERMMDLSRRIGHLEAELQTSKETSQYHKDESSRYRGQRDEARSQLEIANQRIEELESRLDNAHLATPRGRILKTPDKATGYSFHRDSGRKSSESSSSIIAGNMSISAFSPQYSKRAEGLSSSRAALFGPFTTQPNSPMSTPTVRTTKLAGNSIKHNIDEFFKHVEAWAKQYALLRPTAGQNDTYMRTLKARLQTMCKPRDVEEMLEDDCLRCYLAVAIINKTLSQYLGPGCIEGFRCGLDTTLEEVKQQMSDAWSQDAQVYHDLLVRRASVYQDMVSNFRIEAWLDGRVSTIQGDILQILKPLIPEPGWHAAEKDLRRVVKEAFLIGQILLARPREWGVVFAQRGERWDANCMTQKDYRLSNDPKLVESNGFAFVVRLGVEPAVTEKDFSSGTIKLETVHHRSVVLVENANQRTTPQSGKKSAADN